MATINIGAENASDPHYRYKMPKPISKVEGRGNGIKTNVVNNVDIAKALERPPEYILKFLGCELGAQTNYDSKTGTSIVNGSHDANVLMTLIEAFIKKYVQCYNCGNPETTVSIKRENVFLKCKACGHVSEVDMRHKLNNYILKNPPSSGLSKEEKQVKKQEKERLKALKVEKEEKKKEKEKEKARKKKLRTTSLEADADPETLAAAAEDATDEPSPKKEEEAKEEVVWHSDVSAEAIAKRAQEQLSSTSVASMVTQGNIEAEASEAKKKLKKLLAKLEFSDDTVAVINELGTRLYKEDSEAEIVTFLMGALNKASVRMMVLYIVLLWEVPEKLGSVVKEKCGLLKKFAEEAKDQLAQLIGLEYVMAMMISERMKEYPQILKVLYDEDVIDEAIMIGWHQKPAAGQKALGISDEGGAEVRKECEEFVDWLQEEEEDESEDEED